MGPITNRREFTRVPRRIETDVVTPGGTLSGWTQDVSLKGIYFECKTPLETPIPCRITLYLDGRSGTARIEAEGHVSRCERRGMALEFSELRGERSYEHLKNMVIYNASDPEAARAEFESHLGLKRRE